MEITELDINKIKPYSKNAKTHPDEQVQLIANSIKEFGFKTPIVVDANFVIIQGHGRLKASHSLGLKTVPCIVADELSKEQVKMLRLADNKVAESEWDMDILNEELNYLDDLFTIEDFGFELEDEQEEDSNYSDNISAPTYEPSDNMPDITELYSRDKSQELKEKINLSEVPPEIKSFLNYAAERHTVFNYRLIADFYSNSEKEVQELFEDSALIIIDFNKAIEDGYVKLSEKVAEQYEEEYPEEQIDRLRLEDLLAVLSE